MDYMWCLGCQRAIIEVTANCCPQCGRCPGCGIKRASNVDICQNCQHPTDAFRIENLSQKQAIAASNLQEVRRTCAFQNRTRYKRIVVISVCTGILFTFGFIFLGANQQLVGIAGIASSLLTQMGLTYSAYNGWFSRWLLIESAKANNEATG